MYARPCDCPHPFPLCACALGLHGKALRDRSRWLSSIAGWPARIDPDEAARVMAEHGRPSSEAAPAADLLADLNFRPDFPRLAPSEVLDLNGRMKACPHRKPTRECGCGGLAICALGRGTQGTVNQSDCILCLLSQEAVHAPGSMIADDDTR